MWVLTPYGFFSIVQKPDDASRGTLTVRACAYRLIATTGSD